MKSFINILGIGIILALAVAILVPAVAWSGGVFGIVHITLIDNETDQPIEGAEIFMMRDFHLDILNTIEKKQERMAYLDNIRGHGYNSTNSEGEATLGRQFRAGGGSGVFGRTGQFHVNGDLIIEHPEYQKLEMLLANVLQGKIFKLKENEFEITIYLQKIKPNKAVVDNSEAAPLRATP